MYNGRTTQHPESKPPAPMNSEWSRPRKGSYCEYKQQKIGKITNLHQQSSIAPSRSVIGMSKGVGVMNRSVMEEPGRRGSVGYGDGIGLGLEKYASKELRDYQRNYESKYSGVETETNYPARYGRPSSSYTQQPASKSYLKIAGASSKYTAQEDQYASYSRAQRPAFPEAPVGTIVPTGQRKRNQTFYQSEPGDTTYQMGKTRGIDTAGEQQGTRRQRDRYMERAMERVPVRASDYQKYPQKESLYPQPYQKYSQSIEPVYLERRQPARPARQHHADLYARSQDYELPKYPRQDSYKSYGGEQQNKYYITDRESQTYGGYASKSPYGYGEQRQQYQQSRSQNATPTRTKHLPPPPSSKPADDGLSQSRKQQLIQKSRNLNEKLNELSAKKEVFASASKEQRDFKFSGDQNMESYQERIDKIRNNKERVYDSPFKDKIKSTNDLKMKYQLPTEPQTYPNHQTAQIKPRTPVEPALKKSDTNQINSLERSQDLLKRINNLKQTGSPIHNSKLPGPQPQPQKQKGQNEENWHQGYSNQPDNNCMNRINALNSKINQKISLLINAYEK